MMIHVDQKILDYPESVHNIKVCLEHMSGCVRTCMGLFFSLHLLYTHSYSIFFLYFFFEALAMGSAFLMSL